VEASYRCRGSAFDFGGTGLTRGVTKNTGFGFTSFGSAFVISGAVTLAVTAAQSAANDVEDAVIGIAAPGAGRLVFYRWARIAKSRKSTLPSPLKSPWAYVLPPLVL
jgi:hypothetical protein